MRSTLATAAIVFLATFRTVAVDGARAQSLDLPAEARLVGFTVEPEAPEFGEVFDLRITVRIGPGVVAFLPDTLVPGDASFSAGSGDWTEASGPADSVDIQTSYPVMGFLSGPVELPWLELWTRPATGGEVGGARPASDLVDAGPVLGDELQPILISVGANEIIPLSELAEAAGNLFPRPAADVLGGQWSIWFLSAVATAIAGASLAWVLIFRRRRRARRGGAELDGRDRSPRGEALRELDRIRGLGWQIDGLMVEFYDATTGVLRRFSEQEDAEWGVALTSHQLLARLQGRWGSSSVENLGSTISVAERVKFGGHRSEVEAAEDDWMTIRDWIEGMAQD
jgi:hypothetical protein